MAAPKKPAAAPPTHLVNHQFTKGSMRARLAGQKGGKVKPGEPNPYKPAQRPDYLN